MAFTGHLTGGTRLRKGWRGVLIVQVQWEDGSYHDASESDLKAIGFRGSSARGRRELQYARRSKKPGPPPPENNLTGDVPGMKWR